jgi:citrate lyase subunit beta/citryl-CoA lyase
MTPRSFLFVPGDNARKMEKAAGTAAHALVLDLEDAVAGEQLEGARQLVLQHLRSHPDRTRQQVWVRVNPIDSDKMLADLAVIVAGAPDGVLIPKCRCGADIARLDNYLSALEQREKLPLGAIKIIAVATETAAAMFELGSYRGASQRLFGLTWGAEDLSTAVGASTNKSDDGAYAFTYQLARTLCLLGSKVAGVQPVDTIFANFRDPEALRNEVRRARQDGYTAKFAIHPDQVAVINAGFQPDEQEVAHARAVIAAFEATPGAGAVQVNGKMLDKPHLTQALQILQAAGAAA